MSWSFTTGSQSTGPPTVTAETPGSGATGVPVSIALAATFNQAVQPNTINFRFQNSAGSPFAVTTSYNSSTNTATFTPTSPLPYNTEFSAYLSGAQNSSGVAMTGAFSWSFWTDSLQPAVSSHTPASGATAVAVTTTSTATFNEAVQSGTINFTLANSTGTAVAGSVVYNSSTHAATFTPSTALAYGTTYTATVSGAKDTSR